MSLRHPNNRYYEAQEAIENQKRENEKLREDYMKSRDEVNLLELRYEEKVKNLEFQLIEREKEEKLLMDKILTEHNVNVKELNAEWGGRLEEAEKKYRTAMNTKEDLEIELQRVLDSVNIVKQEHSLELKELIERIKDEEYNKYEEKLLSLTARLSALEQAREEHSRKLAADFNEGQHREKKLQDNLLGLEADNNKLISENMSLKNHNEELRQTNDRLKAEIVAKDIKISNLDRENIELHQILNNKKEHHSQEVDNLLREHKQERISWDNLREGNHQKTLNKSIKIFFLDFSSFFDFRPTSQDTGTRKTAPPQRDGDPEDEAGLPKARRHPPNKCHQSDLPDVRGHELTQN